MLQQLYIKQGHIKHHVLDEICRGRYIYPPVECERAIHSTAQTDLVLRYSRRCSDGG